MTKNTLFFIVMLLSKQMGKCLQAALG